MTNEENKHNCQVFHFDLFGTREEKYDYLNQHNLSDVPWEELNPQEPQMFFTHKDFGLQEEYEKGFKIDELFVKYNNGIESGKDDFFFGFDKDSYRKFIKESFDDKDGCSKRMNFKDTDNFRLLTSFRKATYDESKIISVHYRPFDIRSCYYDLAIQRRPAYDLMKHMHAGNIGLLVPRQVSEDFHHVFVSDMPTNCNLTGTAKKFGSAPLFPLYIYQETLAVEERVPNLNPQIVRQIEQSLGEAVEPQELFDYIYAVLHSPGYRERYKEFLKIDFPRIPYPNDWERFRDLVEKGKELRQLHLMENLPHQAGVSFPVGGTLQVDCYRWQQNRVYINAEQYFEGVPESAWNFYIGGYQPAQKWLKDRKGMTLTFEDVKHYQRIIYVLRQTERIMTEIDNILPKS